MNDAMNKKFNYEKGDVSVARSQCELCENYSDNKEQPCTVYDEVPEEILQNRELCSSFGRKGAFRFKNV